jgi:hypothetical protein
MNSGRRTHPQFDDDVVPYIIRRSQYPVAFMFRHKFCEKHTKPMRHITTFNIEFISVASRSMSDNHRALHRATPDRLTNRPTRQSCGHCHPTFAIRHPTSAFRPLSLEG